MFVVNSIFKTFFVFFFTNAVNRLNRYWYALVVWPICTFRLYVCNTTNKSTWHALMCTEIFHSLILSVFSHYSFYCYFLHTFLLPCSPQQLRWSNFSQAYVHSSPPFGALEVSFLLFMHLFYLDCCRLAITCRHISVNMLLGCNNCLLWCITRFYVFTTQ